MTMPQIAFVASQSKSGTAIADRGACPSLPEWVKSSVLRD
jgi:hypothetical protein